MIYRMMSTYTQIAEFSSPEKLFTDDAFTTMLYGIAFWLFLLVI